MDKRILILIIMNILILYTDILQDGNDAWLLPSLKEAKEQRGKYKNTEYPETTHKNISWSGTII